MPRRGEEVVHQRRQVFGPRGKRRHLDLEDPQPMVEVDAKPPGFKSGHEVAIGGCDHPHIDRPRGRCADGRDCAILEHAQELGLHFERRFADLVEQERAAVGLLEEPAAIGRGAGEGAADMAEEFAFDHARREGRQAGGDERAIATAAVRMDGTGGELLAGARLARDQDGQIGGGGHRDLLEHRLHRC